MSNQQATPNNPTAAAKLPTRTEFIRNIREVDIATVPEDDRRCCVCWGVYGETDDISDTSENPVKLSCPHWIGSKCLHSVINKVREPDHKFDNRCPKCRRELFESEVDARLYTLRDDISQVRDRFIHLTWETRETLLSREAITTMLCELDAIINQGAHIGGVYDQEHEWSRENFNNFMVNNWWHCVVNNHIVYYIVTLPEPVVTALKSLNLQHELFNTDEETGEITNEYMDARIGVNEDHDNTTMPAAYTAFRNLFFETEESYSGRPSSHPDIIHHSMMPSQLFLKTLVILQRQLNDSHLTSDGWDLLQLDKGDQGHIEYKKFCHLVALEVATHAIHHVTVEELLEE